MTLSKMTIINSVRYIPKSEQTSEFKQNTINDESNSRKQDKNLSQNKEKFIKNVAAEGIGILE